MRFLAGVLCLFLASLLIAQTSKTPAVKEDGYPLRSGCSDNAEPIAKLSKGQPVKIRFALAGSERPCYAVTVEVNGNKQQGYVGADGLAGLEEFEQARRSASTSALTALPLISRSEVQAVKEKAAEHSKRGGVDYALAAQLNLAADALQAGRPSDAEKILANAGAPRGHREVALLRGYALLQLNQADRALDILEPALRDHRKDPELLALAGRAAYNLDDSARALAYWKESLELKPNTTLEEAYHRVEQEARVDKSSEKNYGMRFLLRYDTAVASPEVARSMLAVLEEEFSRISSQLGCPAPERIITIVESRESYYAPGTAEWSGGRYDGKIRIPLTPAKRVDPQTRRTFAHEIVHACMSNIGSWPAWLHEGLAQKLSGDSLHPGQRQVLQVLARGGHLPKLEELGNGWGRMNITQASVAYSLALAAAELFFEKHSQIGARNLMNNPQLLEQITPELDRMLAESLKGN